MNVLNMFGTGKSISEAGVQNISLPKHSFKDISVDRAQN